MKLIFSHLPLLLILSIAMCFSAGCSGGSGKKAGEASDEKSTAAISPQGGAETTEEKKDTAEAPPPAAPEEGEAPPGETAGAGADPSATATGSEARAVSENKLTTVLEAVAREMEAKNLAYVSSLGQDCSGIFHQIKDSVQVRIPALRDPLKYVYPPFSPDRDSRQVANWYHRHNNLYIVRNALADANKIRPGSVMFYGQTDKTYDNPTIEQLTTRGVGIMHVAVVTSIETDDAGNVTAYTIMHGRNKKWPASRTGGNCDCPKKGLDKQHVKFPFGNWNQAWVAVANIETPVN